MNVLLASQHIIILEHRVRPATLRVQFVRVQAILNVLLVNQGIFCNLHLQQHVLPLALMDIGRILQITFVHLVMLLAPIAQAQTAINVVPAAQSTFNTHRRRQHALILVQEDTMELPVKLVLSVIRIVQFVRLQAIIIVLPVKQGTTCSQLLQQHALTLVQVELGRTLRIRFVHLVTLLALPVRAQTTINVLPAKQGTLGNLHRQYVLPLAQTDTMELPVILVRVAMLIV